jgi:hypothetical protein
MVWERVKDVSITLYIVRRALTHGGVGWGETDLPMGIEPPASHLTNFIEGAGCVLGGVDEDTTVQAGHVLGREDDGRLTGLIPAACPDSSHIQAPAKDLLCGGHRTDVTQAQGDSRPAYGVDFIGEWASLIHAIVAVKGVAFPDDLFEILVATKVRVTAPAIQITLLVGGAVAIDTDRDSSQSDIEPGDTVWTGDATIW